MLLVKFTISIICGMLFMAFIGYSSGTVWGDPKFGLLLFMGAVLGLLGTVCAVSYQEFNKQ